ncbi:glycoside hydrolase family 88/105 protein [Latilactobacillus sakei]|uniref:glycoside hydrolase family 88/105 protein n=1 Tax=Latilactobacillus sakei TaxID=1599 RepID=UPI000DC6485E|nr:glycoside hydrolase family 88 protein [Latilactobacillus sakei]SPS04035.1 Unsaturated rhamnogalacturonyl hydrolase YteR [Latilactobacillus sakei]
MYRGYGNPEDDWASLGVNTLLKRDPIFNKLYNWSYDDGTCLGAVYNIYQLKKQSKMLEYCKSNFDRYLDSQGNIHDYVAEDLALDDICNGKSLLDLYHETKDLKYKKAADKLYEQLKMQPRTEEGTFWHKKRYPSQVWLDGLYMGSVFYAKYQKMFNLDDRYDDVVHQFLSAYKVTLDDESGLCYHAYDEARQQPWVNKETGHSPHFWTRAIGWFVMAMADVLEYLPEDIEGRKQIIDNLDHLLKALKDYSDPQTHLWYQVTDEIDRPMNYIEQSGSSMILAAMAKGVRMGYLNASDYEDFIEKGWVNSLEQFITITNEGYVNTNRTCQVGGLGGPNKRDGSYAYYMSEPVISNDHKGYGAFLYLAYEMEQRKVNN